MNLNEVRFVLLLFRLECAQCTGRVVRQPIVTHTIFVLTLPNGFHMHRGVAQVVHLHEIDRFAIHEVSRTLHLCGVSRLAVGPDFRGEKQVAACCTSSDDITDNFFGAVVHW